jgi:predicted metal-dependent hydrolase
MSGATEYDPRYLRGIALFNEREYFDAHEVWEDLWHDTAGPERRFYQALIQVAVAVYHASNGNTRGAVRLYHSAQRYMQAFGPRYNGLDIGAFWDALRVAMRAFLDPAQPAPVLDEAAVPTMVLLPDSPPL